MKNIILTFATLLSLSSYAQNAFKGDMEAYDHNYKSVVNTEKYAKWVLDQEKSWYLAPDSMEAKLMTVKEWNAERLALKLNGFNELDSRYYWNPNTRTSVMVFKHERTGQLHIDYEYGTDIR
jgi:hypothetical protein